MNHPLRFLRRPARPALLLLASLALGPAAAAAPAGPAPQVPAEGRPPGAYPNTSVSAVNVIARGSTVFNSSVDVPGLDGQGPVAWSVNRYNRGDFALRLAPGNPVAALTNLGLGFIEFGDNSPALAASQAWRPTVARGVVLPVARQNGPIDWNDGEGPFFPTVAVSWASSGPGYDMLNGAFANGDLDINTGRAGTHGSSPEANFGFSAVWFPYDQGWLAGEFGGPVIGNADPNVPDGSAAWTRPDAHAAGLTANLLRWPDFPAGSGQYGGHAELRLPGVNTLEDGMLFTTSSDGGSDVNIVGVAPTDDGAAWLVTIREDAETTAEVLAAANQSEFQFVYVPFDAPRLVGGHVVGATGAKRKAAGDFGVTRTGTGSYEITIPGKTGASGTLLLQAADLEPGTSEPLATRAFLSQEFSGGRFIVESRKTTSDTAAELADANFYVAWVDFAEPLAAPAGPRLRSLPAVVVNGDGVTAREAGVAAHPFASEILVTTVDDGNTGGHVDPITQQPALDALVGRYYDPATLAPLGDPFVIVGNPAGDITRHDVKFNAVSNVYVVVANTRARGTNGRNVPTIALVRPASDPAAGSRVIKSFVYDEASENNYDDVAVAVSSKNGNFLVASEYSFPGEGEGVLGILFDGNATEITTGQHRLDQLQSIGDEDDPDVAYLPQRDVFLYISNTDNSNGSTGTLGNRIVGAVVQTTPGTAGALTSTVEQPLGDGDPAGTPEGHPAAIESPFTGQIVAAYDYGNNTANGDVSFTAVGAGPTYMFTAAQPEVPYLRGAAGDPFNHQHPQLAADPVRGVIIVGHNATASTVGLPEAYAFSVFGPDGQPLPGQLDVPYLLAEAPGGLGNSANFHTVTYSPASGSFLAVYNSTPGVTYLAALEVTSSHLAPAEPPTLAIARGGGGVVVSWPADAEGFALEGSPTLAPAAWQPAGGAPVVENGRKKVTVTPGAGTEFFQLRRP